MDQKQLQELATLTLGEARTAAQEYSRLKGFKLDSVVGFFRTTKVIVQRVEEVGLARGLAGADKQALAIELLFQVVKLPWWVPKTLLRQYLPDIIDLVVDALKDRMGA